MKSAFRILLLTMLINQCSGRSFLMSRTQQPSAAKVASYGFRARLRFLVLVLSETSRVLLLLKAETRLKDENY